MYFIIAIRNTYPGRFRVYDTESKTCEDFTNTQLTSKLMQGFRVENAKLEHEHVSPYRMFIRFLECGCDDSRLPLLTENGELRYNSKSVVVTAIDGEFVECVNWEGKSCKVHMLQIANNVNSGKIVLANATVHPNGWVTAGRQV